MICSLDIVLYSVVIMYIISHRGYHDKFPENSLEAINGAIALGYNEVEFDVRQTKDGKLILSHDSISAGLDIANTESTELSLPLLEDALRCFEGKECVARIEIKNADHAVISSLLKKFTAVKMVLTSFDFTLLQNIKKTLPEIECVPLQHGLPLGIAKKARKLNSDSIGINKWWLLVLPVYIYLLNSQKKIHVYTVNSKLVANIINFVLFRSTITTDNASLLR